MMENVEEMESKRIFWSLPNKATKVTFNNKQIKNVANCFRV